MTNVCFWWYSCLLSCTHLCSHQVVNAHSMLLVIAVFPNWRLFKCVLAEIKTLKYTRKKANQISLCYGNLVVHFSLEEEIKSLMLVCLLNVVSFIQSILTQPNHYNWRNWGKLRKFENHCSKGAYKKIEFLFHL